jgi:hypothetical protein
MRFTAAKSGKIAAIYASGVMIANAGPKCILAEGAFIPLSSGFDAFLITSALPWADLDIHCRNSFTVAKAG